MTQGANWFLTKIMHQILLNTICLENNSLTTFREKKIMTSNPVVENTTPIKQTIIVQLLIKHRNFSPTDFMFLNQTETECTKTVSSEK